MDPVGAVDRLDPGQIIIAGDTGVVSSAVQTALDPYTAGSVTRLAGADRYRTSVAISRASFPSGASRAYVAAGTNFPDALAAAPVAGINGAPLLLVPPTGIPAFVMAELDRLNVTEVVMLGGTGALTITTLTAAGTVTALAGTGTLTALPAPAVPAPAGLSGGGTLTAEPAPTVTADPVDLTGTGTLTARGTGAIISAGDWTAAPVTVPRWRVGTVRTAGWSTSGWAVRPARRQGAP